LGVAPRYFLCLPDASEMPASAKPAVFPSRAAIIRILKIKGWLGVGKAVGQNGSSGENAESEWN
jgi:hypothetical protein